MRRLGRGPLVVLVLSCLVVGMVVSGPTTDTAAATSGPGPSVRLAGPIPVLPTGATVVGPSDASAPVSAQVALKPRDTAALDAFVTAVSSPGSPRYHHYLAPGQFASTFGPTPDTIAATRAWLTSSGLQVGATSPDGLLIPVSGSTAQIEQALDVSVVSARLPDGRVARFTPQRPAVPTALASSLTGVVGLSTVAAPQPQLVAAPRAGRRHQGAEPVDAAPVPYPPSDRDRALRPPPPTGIRPTSWPRRTDSTPCTVTACREPGRPSGSTSSSRTRPATSPPTSPATGSAPR